MDLNQEELEKRVKKLKREESDLTSEIAVLDSKINTSKEELAEKEARVLEIVGSTDSEKVQEYIDKLDEQIQKDLKSLESLADEDDED